MSLLKVLAGRRRAGALLHPTALPGDSGALGARARDFVDWLASAGFSWWQVLPLGPVGVDGSPYWARSDQALDPRLIDREEWLAAGAAPREFASFCEAQQDWLADYALYEALGVEHSGAPWRDWPAALRQREPAALQQARTRHSATIAGICEQQWNAERQWQALRAYAAERGIRIFGDLPIYVAPEAVDVWMQPQQFQLRSDGQPQLRAGVPPDYFAADGQLWGNPLYDWTQALRDDFAFWRQRLRAALRRFDLLRIDHFRGLSRFWAVAAEASTARDGQWLAAPGKQLLTALRQQYPALPLVAEDLGLIDAAVTKLRCDFQLPGMRVLQFAFDGAGDNPHLPHNYGPDVVAYTGTHDNDTSVGWYRALAPHDAELVNSYVGVHGDWPGVALADGLLRTLFASVAPLAVAPVQDLLGLGTEARFNVPGVASGNWRWKLAADELTAARAQTLATMLRICGRSSAAH
jgi:4-alpha-glucanotransferase